MRSPIVKVRICQSLAEPASARLSRSDGSAAFVGLERIVGRIGGKSGTFVLQRIGVFESGEAKESYTIIPGSGTGERQGLRGEGNSTVGHGMEHPFSLDYDLG
jgi:hypothetical protein